MKSNAAKLIAAVVLAGALAAPVSASRFHNTNETHPLKVVGYVGHGIGQVVTFLVFRPIHWAVSQPYLDVFFGHKTDPKDTPHHFEYLHGDYSPSIAESRKARMAAQTPANSGTR